MTRSRELIKKLAQDHNDLGNNLLVQDDFDASLDVPRESANFAISSKFSRSTVLSFRENTGTASVSKRQGGQSSVPASGDTLDPNLIIKIAIIAGVVLVLIIIIGVVACFLCRRKSRRKASTNQASSSSGISGISSIVSLPEATQNFMQPTLGLSNATDIHRSDSSTTNHHKTNPSSSKSLTTSLFGPSHDIKNFSRPMSPLVVESEEERKEPEPEPKPDLHPYPLNRQASSPTDNEVFTAAFQSMIGLEDTLESNTSSERPQKIHFSETFGKWTPRWDSRQSVQMTFPKPPRGNSYLIGDQIDQPKADENFLMVVDKNQLIRSSVASSTSTTNTSILDPFDKSRHFYSEDVPPVPPSNSPQDHDPSNDKVEVVVAPEIDLSLPLRSNGPDNVTEQIIFRPVKHNEPLISPSSRTSIQRSNSFNYTHESTDKRISENLITLSPLLPAPPRPPRIIETLSSPPISPEKKQLRTRAILNLSMDDLSSLANTIQQHRNSWNQSSPTEDLELGLDCAPSKQPNILGPDMLSRPSSILSTSGHSAAYFGNDEATDEIMDAFTEYSRESIYALYEPQYELQVPQQSHSRSRSASPRTPDSSIWETPPSSPRHSTGSLLSPIPRKLTQSRSLSPIPEFDSQYDRDRFSRDI